MALSEERTKRIYCAASVGLSPGRVRSEGRVSPASALWVFLLTNSTYISTNENLGNHSVPGDPALEFAFGSNPSPLPRTRGVEVYFNSYLSSRFPAPWLDSPNGCFRSPKNVTRVPLTATFRYAIVTWGNYRKMSFRRAVGRQDDAFPKCAGFPIHIHSHQFDSEAGVRRGLGGELRPTPAPSRMRRAKKKVTATVANSKFESSACNQTTSRNSNRNKRALSVFPGPLSSLQPLASSFQKPNRHIPLLEFFATLSKPTTYEFLIVTHSPFLFWGDPPQRTPMPDIGSHPGGREGIHPLHINGRYLSTTAPMGSPTGAPLSLRAKNFRIFASLPPSSASHRSSLGAVAALGAEAAFQAKEPNRT